jgi:hypothetical protein
MVDTVAVSRANLELAALEVGDRGVLDLVRHGEERRPRRTQSSLPAGPPGPLPPPHFVPVFILSSE